MKIKVMKRDGSNTQLYECEDVTVTYYTEGTLAYQDALKNWKSQLQSYKQSLELYQSNLKGAKSNVGDLTARLEMVEAEIESRTYPTTLQLWTRRLFPWVQKRVDREDRELLSRRDHVLRQLNSAKSHASRLETSVSQAQKQLTDFENDPLTPGMELAIRLRDRSITRVGLPSHGDVAYIENDQGKTIDKFEWPLKRVPVALRAG